MIYSIGERSPDAGQEPVGNKEKHKKGLHMETSDSIWELSGNYPLQLQGEPTYPRGQSVPTQEGMIEELSKLSNLSERLARHSRESREEPEPGSPAEKEVEDGADP